MLIVDGHNVAFADDEARRCLDAKRPGAARLRVMELVSIYAESTDERALVVFDGAGGPHRPQHNCARVRYCFSGEHRSADAEILERLRRFSGRRETCVVTTDRSLGAAVRALHAKTMDAADFLSEVARRGRRRQETPPAPEPLAKRIGAPAGEVDYWLTVFSEEDVEVAEREAEDTDRRKRRT
jgi:predicted RNA-binding protein with PIN domain